MAVHRENGMCVQSIRKECRAFEEEIMKGRSFWFDRKVSHRPSKALSFVNRLKTSAIGSIKYSLEISYSIKAL